MHIGIVTSGLGAGGAERVIALVSAHWVAAGHKVTLFTFDSPADPVFHPLDPQVRLVRLGLPSGGSRFGTFRRIRALRAAFRRETPDAVVSFLFKINVLTLLAAAGLKVPVAVSERNHPRLQPAHPAWRWLARLTYPHARAILLQTEASRAAMPAPLRSRCRVIPNPVSRFDRTPEADGPKILSAVGRLDPQKGFDQLIAAFARIAPDHPDWTLRIRGEGPLRPALAHQIEGLGMAGRIELPGLSNGPGGWIRESAAFAMTSRYEGFPNALAEAGLAGLPRIATRFQFGADEQIEDGVDGLLVEPGNIPSLAMSLDRLLSDRGLRDSLGKNARDSGRRFLPGRILHLWDGLLPLLE